MGDLGTSVGEYIKGQLDYGIEPDNIVKWGEVNDRLKAIDGTQNPENLLDLAMYAMQTRLKSVNGAERGVMGTLGRDKRDDQELTATVGKAMIRLHVRMNKRIRMYARSHGKPMPLIVFHGLLQRETRIVEKIAGLAEQKAEAGFLKDADRTENQKLYDAYRKAINSK